jgi:hypothetical protein
MELPLAERAAYTARIPERTELQRSAHRLIGYASLFKLIAVAWFLQFFLLRDVPR